MNPATAVAGAFVVSLDSMVNIAFPAMASGLDVPPEDLRWVIIGYVLSYAVTSFVGGAAADRLGYAGVFCAGAGLSAAALLGGGLAPTFESLVAARVAQGVGGGLVYGTVPGIVTLAAGSASRSRALGRLNAAIGLGFTVGAPLAGVLVDAAGWRTVFLVRAPLALAVLILALAWRRPAGADGPRRRIVASADVLKASVLVPGAVSFGANAGIFAVWLLAPFYLVASRGLDASLAGWLFMLTPFGTAVAATLAGWAAERLGNRALMVAGLALEAAGLFLLSRAEAATPVPIIAAALFAAGFGLGMFQVPNMSVIMSAFSTGHQGAAGGFAFLARTLGIVAGVSLLAHVFAARRVVEGFDLAFGEALVVATLVVVVATGLACARIAS